MGVIQWFQENIVSNTLMMVFLIAVIGYLVGSIRICGLELGTAGILLVALVFGHFGIEIPDLVRELGLICFVTSVGFIAGPKFFRNFKHNAASYILLGFLVIAAGALVCVAVIQVFGIPTDISVGMMTGALTSTPGLAAALEATGSDAASVGYGIAYPFGVVGVVLFVQLVPKLLKVDMAAERASFEAAAGVEVEEYHKTKKEALFYADSMGFFPFSLAIALGIILAKIEIPLPGGAVFALGTSGGPLIAGLILGHFGHFGRLSVQVEKHVLECLREFGLALFLLGAGSQAGAGFVEILKGAWTASLPLWSADDADPDVRRLFLRGEGAASEPFQYTGLHLRRHDEYAGPGNPDPCGGDRRCGKRLRGHLPDRAGVGGAGQPVHRDLPVERPRMASCGNAMRRNKKCDTIKNRFYKLSGGEAICGKFRHSRLQMW